MVGRSCTSPLGRYKELALNRISRSFGSPNGGSHTWRWHMKRLLVVLFPCLRWLSAYDVSKHLRDDIIAGITVGVMLVPQVRFRQMRCLCTMLNDQASSFQLRFSTV